MQRLFFSFRNIFKRNLRIRNSFTLSDQKSGLYSENLLRENPIQSYDVPGYTHDRILFNNDLIEIAAYEHYFTLSDNPETKVTPTEQPTANISSLFVKTKTFEILDGIQILKTHSNLPKKLQEVMDIVDRKLRIFYPDYVDKCNTDVNISIANQFIKDIISNSNVSAAYIDVSLRIGLFGRAFNYMKKIRMENKQPICVNHKSIIVDSVFYEPVVYLLAKNGNLASILNIIAEMEEARIKPSLPVLFSCLEAAGRKDIIDKTIIQKLLNHINSHQVSLHKALLSVPIFKENYPFILKAINTSVTDFNFDVTKDMKRNNNVGEGLKYTPLNATIKDLNKLFDEQLEVEKVGCSTSDITTKEQNSEELLTKVEILETEWRNYLREALKKRQNIMSSSDRWRLYPFLTALSDQTYVDVMISIVHRCMNDKSLEFTHINNLYIAIGDSLENHYHHRCLKKDKYFLQLKNIYSSFLTRLESEPHNADMDLLWHQATIDNITNGNIQLRSIAWDPKLKSKLGRIIYEIMFENLYVTFRDTNGLETRTPVLYEELIEEAEIAFTAVRVQSKVSKMFKIVNKALLGLSPLELPMLHPPVPVYDNFTTGYFHVRNDATRLVRKSSEVELYDDDLRQPGNIRKIYNALNVLAMCSWKIDSDNLDIVTEIFKDKGNMKLKIPTRAEEMEKPIKSGNMSDYKTYSLYTKAMSNYKKDKKNMYSLWVTLLYKINIAHKLRGKQFWFPYSMDFRSRVYPCPPHLNHIGDDVTRGLLKFSTGKKLGPKGLDWLKIHLINLYGLHKRSSNAERLAAANANLSEIVDSVLNPLTGRKWWQESENPWQTLLACREIFQALKFADEEGNGSSDEFVSHFGVQQDGSCNGLQHYAALGRDAEGARAVNLIDLESPQDVYSDVLKYVKLKIKYDFDNGVEEAQDLGDSVTRKVIKQTVMTTVYGVTSIGARSQVHKQLKELGILPPEKLFKCSLYLSKVVLSSIGEIFCSATKIQNWFVELASSVAKCRKANISWITPLNLLVTQPYYQDKHPKVLRTDARRNRSAFPPNFIHSLDSTHMMMTALRCWEQNVTFVSVHDCYWTHACDVETMNKICREEFVSLYKTPILENLAQYLYQKHGFNEDSGRVLSKHEKRFNELCKNIPTKGSYDIENVLKSTYFFS